MTGREWAPGMRALVEVEVESVGNMGVSARVPNDDMAEAFPFEFHSLIPLPGDDVIELAQSLAAQAVATEFWEMQAGAKGSKFAVPNEGDVAVGHAVVAALASAGLLATRPEHVVKAEALREFVSDIDSTGYGWTSVVDAERFKDRVRERADRIEAGGSE